jgi:hypothetical protein
LSTSTLPTATPDSAYDYSDIFYDEDYEGSGDQEDDEEEVIPKSTNMDVDAAFFPESTNLDDVEDDVFFEPTTTTTTESSSARPNSRTRPTTRPRPQPTRKPANGTSNGQFGPDKVPTGSTFLLANRILLVCLYSGFVVLLLVAILVVFCCIHRCRSYDLIQERTVSTLIFHFTHRAGTC